MKTLLLTVFCFVETVVFSQTVKKQTANEIRLNLMTTLYWTPEISYERVKTADLGGFAKSDYFGYGLSACATLTDSYSQRRIYETNFQIVPYFSKHVKRSPIRAGQWKQIPLTKTGTVRKSIAVGETNLCITT